MSQFTIIGTPLYQWESGRKMRITPLRGMTVDSVHFSNYGDSEALVVKPKKENGHYIADIPNILLQDDQNIVVYSVNVSEDKVETIRECVFPVRKRAKPSSYVYTETEVLNYATLEKRISKMELEGGNADNSGSSGGDGGGGFPDSVILKDQTTGTSYALYVTAGKLTMEEAEADAETVDGVSLLDTETGKSYIIYVSGGKLSMKGVDE